MAKNTKEQVSPREANRRFEATLRGALKTPPKPLKSVIPKRSKPQRKSRGKN